MEAEALAMHADDAEEKAEQEMKSAPKPKGAAKGKVGHRISLLFRRTLLIIKI
jgi:hypothetical protein